MTSITLEGVTRTYPTGETVLQDVDLHIESGELMVLLGPSGCGKTTVLRLIAGLDAPTGGRILFGRSDMAGVPTRERNVAMVQQDGSLYAHLSAGRNIGFPLAMRGVPKQQSEREVEAGAARLGIRDLLGKMPAELSAGHRHSVATARALIRECSVLLMDEPLATLDAQIRERTRLEVARLHSELKTTTVYVTNDEREAMALGDRVAVFDETGTLRRVGSPQEVYAGPGSLFVARFVGDLNHTLTRLERDDQSYRLQLGGDRLLLEDGVVAAHPGLEHYRGEAVMVGVRPEHVSVASPGTPFASCLHGTVRRVEDIGSLAFAWVTVGSWDLKVRISEGLLPVPGNIIEIAVDPDRLHFFDPIAGTAI